MGIPHEENQAIFAQVVRTKEPYQVSAKPFVFPEKWGRIYFHELGEIPYFSRSNSRVIRISTSLPTAPILRPVRVANIEDGKYSGLGSESGLVSKRRKG